MHAVHKLYFASGWSCAFPYCAAHRLNLVIVYSVRNSAGLTDFFNNLTVSTGISVRVSVHSQFEKLGSTMNKPQELQKLNEMQWVCQYYRMQNNYRPILEALSEELKARFKRENDAIFDGLEGLYPKYSNFLYVGMIISIGQIFGCDANHLRHDITTVKSIIDKTCCLDPEFID